MATPQFDVYTGEPLNQAALHLRQQQPVPAAAPSSPSAPGVYPTATVVQEGSGAVPTATAIPIRQPQMQMRSHSSGVSPEDERALIPIVGVARLVKIFAILDVLMLVVNSSKWPMPWPPVMMGLIVMPVCGLRSASTFSTKLAFVYLCYMPVDILLELYSLYLKLSWSFFSVLNVIIDLWIINIVRRFMHAIAALTPAQMQLLMALTQGRHVGPAQHGQHGAVAGRAQQQQQQQHMQQQHMRQPVVRATLANGSIPVAAVVSRGAAAQPQAGPVVATATAVTAAVASSRVGV
jgi:hypothetical protein